MSTLLSAHETTVIGTVPTGLFIGGSWRPATGGATIAVDDPSTGEVIAQVADATVEDGRCRAGRRGRRPELLGGHRAARRAARSCAGPSS